MFLEISAERLTLPRLSQIKSYIFYTFEDWFCFVEFYLFIDFSTCSLKAMQKQTHNYLCVYVKGIPIGCMTRTGFVLYPLKLKLQEAEAQQARLHYQLPCQLLPYYHKLSLQRGEIRKGTAG